MRRVACVGDAGGDGAAWAQAGAGAAAAATAAGVCEGVSSGAHDRCRGRFKLLPICAREHSRSFEREARNELSGGLRRHFFLFLFLILIFSYSSN